MYFVPRVTPPSESFPRRIRYLHHSTFPGWDSAREFLSSVIARHRPEVVFEIGSGANPTLSIDDVMSHGVRYITSDLSDEELRKAPPGYDIRQLDLESSQISAELIGSCDLMFSRMVNEHVRQGRQYHTNVFRMLRPGGLAVHCYATLYALPFVANYLLPDSFSDRVLQLVSPRLDLDQHGKFRAHYSWSRGPTSRMIRRFESIGYEIESFDGYFGHGYYEYRLPWLHGLEELKARFLLRHPNPNLCAFSTVILRKPRSGRGRF